jgi:2-octaprenyl-3-methyl-6-methoxy-1,4-benzoquinol hydroxylase
MALGKLSVYFVSSDKILTMQHFDCAIVGGGMIGATTALCLAQLGLKVAIIEHAQPKHFSAEQSHDLRVSAVSIASQKLLTQVDAWSHIVSQRLCPYQRLAVWENENAYVEFNAKDINQSHLGHIIENRVIQLALWEKIKDNDNIQTFCPDSLHNLEQACDRVTLSLSRGAITANLVVGADGPQSNVRKMSAIGTTGWDYQQSALLIHVETSAAQQDITWQRFFPSGPIAFLPLSGQSELGSYASLVWYDNRDEINRLGSLSDVKLQAAVLAKFPKRLGAIKVLAKGAFPITRSHANHYQHKRVLLVGDAAHTINPMAGQGVNLGFKDVAALQQVIVDAIANGDTWHNPEVLTRYEKLRRNDNLLMMSTMDGLYVSFSHPSPLIKVVRNAALMAINKAPWLNTEVKKKALSYACGLPIL